MPPARSPRTERTLAALRVVFLAHGAHVQEYAALRVLEYNFFGEGRWTTLAQSMRLERVRAMAALGNVIGQGRPARVEAVLRSDSNSSAARSAASLGVCPACAWHQRYSTDTKRSCNSAACRSSRFL